MPMVAVNLVTPKVAAKLELLFNKPAIIEQVACKKIKFITDHKQHTYIATIYRDNQNRKILTMVIKMSS